MRIRQGFKITAAAAAAAGLTFVAAGPALASTTFAGVPSSRTLVSENDITLHTGDTVTTGGRSYTVTTVQNGAGGTTFGVNPALPAGDVHRSIPFTLGS